MEGMRRVTLRNPSGEPLPFELPDGVTVVEARTTIERAVGVRASSLGIFESKRECADREQLRSTQSLTLVIRFEPFLHDLQLSDEEDPLHRRRSSALLFMYRHVPRDDACTMAKVASAFGRALSWIRPATIAADAGRYARGDGRAILGVVALLDHQASSVRRAALEAIPKVCAKGDELALRALAWRLVDACPQAKTEVPRALAYLAPRGDDQAAQKLASRMEADEASRKALLGSFDGPDLDCVSNAVDTVVSLLREQTVGSTTVPARSSRSARSLEDGSEATSEQSACVEHRSSDSTHNPGTPGHEPRLETLDASAARLGKAGSKAWECLREQARDAREGVRQAILDVVKAAPGAGPKRAMDPVVVMLEDPAPDMRSTALLLVWLLALKGSKGSLDLAISRLADDSRAVRFTAVQVVVELAGKGNFHAFQSLAGCLGDTDVFVRAEAVRGMGELVDKRDDRTVDVLLEVLRRGEGRPAMQAAALEALAASSEPGDQRAHGIVAEFLLHENVAVSRASMQAMSTIVQSQGVTAAWEARKRRYSDFNMDRDKALDMYAQGSRLMKSEMPARAPSNRRLCQHSARQSPKGSVNPGEAGAGWAEYLQQSGDAFATTMGKVWSMVSSDGTDPRFGEQPAAGRPR